VISLAGLSKHKVIYVGCGSGPSKAGVPSKAKGKAGKASSSGQARQARYNRFACLTCLPCLLRKKWVTIGRGDVANRNLLRITQLAFRHLVKRSLCLPRKHQFLTSVMASILSADRETVMDDESSLTTTTTKSVPFTFPPLPLKSTPPFLHDPALIQFKYTTVKDVVYRFQEKSALKRVKHPSWIWRYGSECVRERHPESIYWSCDLC
jgi:hypothetical protein